MARLTRTFTDDEASVVRLAYSRYGVSQDDICRRAGVVVTQGKRSGIPHTRLLQLWLAGKPGREGSLDAVVAVCVDIVRKGRTPQGIVPATARALTAALSAHAAREGAGTAPPLRPQIAARQSATPTHQ